MRALSIDYNSLTGSISSIGKLTARTVKSGWLLEEKKINPGGSGCYGDEKV
jgi:hypothetical protein